MNEPWISQEKLGLLIMVIFIPMGATRRDVRQLFRSKRKSQKTYLGAFSFSELL